MVIKNFVNNCENDKEGALNALIDKQVQLQCIMKFFYLILFL